MLYRPAIITRRALLSGAAASTIYAGLGSRPAHATTLPFDPSFTSPNAVLRGNGFTLDGNGYTADWQSALASSLQTGDLYFEYQLNGGPDFGVGFGVGNNSVNLGSYIGSNTSGVGVNNQSGNDIYYNGAQTGEQTGSGGWGYGKILGHAVSTAADKFWIWFGSSWTPAGSNPVDHIGGFNLHGIGSVRPGFSTFDDVQSINPGNFPFFFTVPSGFSAFNTGISAYTAGVSSFDAGAMSGSLSQSNLRFTANSGILNFYQLAYGTKAIPVGSTVYFEFRVDGATLGGVTKSAQIGIRRAGGTTANTDIDIGTDFGLAFNAIAGTVTANGATLATLTSWRYVGCVVGVHVKMSTGKLHLSIDGVWDGDPVTGAGGYCVASILAAGDIYACAGVNGNADNNFIAANFGGYAFQYPIPAGAVSLDAAQTPSGRPRAVILP